MRRLISIDWWYVCGRDCVDSYKVVDRKVHGIRLTRCGYNSENKHEMEIGARVRRNPILRATPRRTNPAQPYLFIVRVVPAMARLRISTLSFFYGITFRLWTVHKSNRLTCSGRNDSSNRRIREGYTKDEES